MKMYTFKLMSRILILLAMFFVTTANAAVKSITINQAKRLYDGGALFIDTRTYIERAFGVVKGSIAIKKNEVTKKLNLLPNDKALPLVVYCARGVRAATVADRLDKEGYQTIYVMSDVGFGAWKDAGYPVE